MLILPEKNCNFPPTPWLLTWKHENKRKKLQKGRSMGKIRDKALKASYPNGKNELPRYFETPAPLEQSKL